jgi:hypothetical protein
MRLNASLLLGLLGLAAHTAADPTWPADIDELEEIMFQVFNFRSRKFADTVFPCTNEASGAGRQNAAEWLRTTFHDMATGNSFSGAGGLDGSLQYELTNGENTGPGFGTSLSFYATYLTKKSSISDLIALGTYFAVRSCGGPIVPIRAGRIDSKVKAVILGVPQVTETVQVFASKFARMGFSPAEMAQAVACGHTLGGVHSADFPAIVPAGTTANGEATFDTTVGAFDNKIVTEYLDGTTKNPLVVGPSRTLGSLGQHSDFKVFNNDNNATLNGLRDAAVFRDVCKNIFTRMIELVPSAVTLSAPIAPYRVKPVKMQLSVNPAGSTLFWAGFIRVWTKDLPSTIAGVTINYKNRNGGTTCGSGPCVLMSTISGIGKGFDDEFNWFPINQNIPTASGVSSFTVTVRFSDGTSQVFDNNGASYPLQDGIMLQTGQSCLLQGSGAFNVTAAIRNDRKDMPAKVVISYKATQTNSPIPALNTITLDLVKGACAGSYTFFSAQTVIPGGRSFESTVDLISGDGASILKDDFKDVNPIGGTCLPFQFPPTCSSVTVSSVVPTSTSATSSAAPTATLSHKQAVGGYKFVSCWTEATGARALGGAAFAYDGMTLETCMGNCTGFDMWGTEYGRECYCGNSLDATSIGAPITECSMPCAGNPYEYCGAGNRIELFTTVRTTTTSAAPTASTTAPSITTTSSAPASTTTSSTSAAPTQSLHHLPTVGRYSFVGCVTEATGVRALGAAVLANDDMTNEICADFCSAYTYFGTEYGRECK